MHLSRLLLLALPLVRPQRTGLACRCGHSTVAHEHYRTGRDCALCACVRWRAERPVPAWARPDERARSVA